MIVIRKVLASQYNPISSVYVSLYSEDEPGYDTNQEDVANGIRAERGESPEYGPGLRRCISNKYMEAGGSGPTMAAAIADLAGRRTLKGAKKRLERAQRKLEFEQARYNALLDIKAQRVFNSGTMEEVSDDDKVTTNW